jgi:hypothetical protein
MSRSLIGLPGVMIMNKPKISFEKIQVEDSNVAALGSLVYDDRQRFGPGAIVDLSDLKSYQLLARDLMAALYEYATPSRIGSGLTLRMYGTSIRYFIDYCASERAPSDLRLGQVDTTFLVGYRAHLRLIEKIKKSNHRRRLYGNISRLIQTGQTIGLAKLDFEIPRNFRVVPDGDITQPYTASESIEIENACRRHIREVLDRLEEGKRLLELGSNPKGRKRDKNSTHHRSNPILDEDKAWNRLENLLWYVVNCMDGRYISGEELMTGGHSSFRNSVMGVWKGAYRKPDVYSHLYPLEVDLIPFIILLAKSTGRNESSILTLRRDCLQEHSGRYILRYEKSRGASRSYKKAIPNDGPFSPVALIQILQAITEPLVRHTEGESKDRLFLGLAVYGGKNSKVRPPDPSYIKYLMNRDGGWCDQNKLLDKHGKSMRISLRRLRVLYLTRKYQAHGQLAKITRDAAHTFSQTTVSYLNNDAVKHVHEDAIEAGIHAALNVVQPTVLVSDDTEDVAAALGSSSPEAAKILRGEQDVLFASCKDFYNRPDGNPNTPCDKVWSCLTCSNAIITRHVLPRVIALKHFMAEQRNELHPDDWEAKFSSAWQILTQSVLPKFSMASISEAEQHLAANDFYVPIGLKA